MSDHDIVETGVCSVTCRCGTLLVASSLEAARVRHEFHFGLESAKAALRERNRI